MGMTREAALIAVLEIAMIFGVGKAYEPEFVIDAIRAYVDERYEIDFSDMQGEYLDGPETAEWLELYLKEKA
jgi:hypothetical protein